MTLATGWLLFCCGLSYVGGSNDLIKLVIVGIPGLVHYKCCFELVTLYLNSDVN